MFYHIFQEDSACWYRVAVFADTRNVRTVPEASGRDFGDGTTAKPRDQSCAADGSPVGCSSPGVSG